MKLKEALKKFNFVKKLELPIKVTTQLVNHLAMLLKGSSEVYMTPLAVNTDPLQILVEWDVIFEKNKDKMNLTLLNLEKHQRSKFGPRSIALPWSERKIGIESSYSCQSEQYDNPLFYSMQGPSNLKPLSKLEAAELMKPSSSSGLPFLTKKRVSKNELVDNFDKYLDRKDPAMLYTRTDDNKKTRNVWGYPFADTLLEIMFYAPLQVHQRSLPYRAALVSPDEVARGITKIILKAIESNCIIYSVDFAGYDASIRYQYIIKAFDYIKRCYASQFEPFLTYVCERFYSINIVSPVRIHHGNHGVPSGSGFTNEVDSIIQIGIAMLCTFLSIDYCQVQGDDGVYMLKEENIKEFEDNFILAGLKLQKEKSYKSTNFAIYCQNLYHYDYRGDDGIIHGIYPLYRALNHLLFQERFVDFGNHGIIGRDYYGIRCLTILENCKYHPLFEDFVRYILVREKYSLEISDDGIIAYCNRLVDTTIGLNHQYGSNVIGIRNFVAYKMVTKLIAEEGFMNSEQLDSSI